MRDVITLIVFARIFSAVGVYFIHLSRPCQNTLHLDFFDPDARDMVSCRAAADFGCAWRQRDAENGVSVIELSYRKLRQIKADPPVG